VRLIEGESEIVPGITALPAPGHTPGQIALWVDSGGEQLLYLSDAVLHPIFLEHPDWYSVYDRDRPVALATMRRLVERAVDTGALVHGFHFDPAPGLGRIRTDGNVWRWEPVATAAVASTGA
jgi:glyoxylase-like metal-dependent hydrolase (beta-lactamase superfamily II)